MKKTIVYLNESTLEIMKQETGTDTPLCGEHFCDKCGDCLVCDSEFDCFASTNADCSEHIWVEYVFIDGEYNA